MIAPKINGLCDLGSFPDDFSPKDIFGLMQAERKTATKHESRQPSLLSAAHPVSTMFNKQPQPASTISPSAPSESASGGPRDTNK
jgi:hypothetical protein